MYEYLQGEQFKKSNLTMDVNEQACIIVWSPRWKYDVMDTLSILTASEVIP